MFINGERIYNSGRLYVDGGESKYLSETKGVPQGSEFKLRWIMRDDLSKQRVSHSVYKVIDCIEEDDSTTTTIQEDPDLTPTTTILIDPDPPIDRDDFLSLIHISEPTRRI